MKKKILTGLSVFFVVLALFLAYVAFQPSDFKVERRAVINAPAEVVFAQVNDFHKWQAWNPWQKMEPTAKNTYDGPPSGPGAMFSWVGDKTGEGRMTIAESKPNSLIRINLEFFKPFASNNTAEFTFIPAGNKTVVTWTMTGTHSFLPKIMCTFMSMDKMVGSEFEKGLNDMKEVAEASATKQLPF